MSDETKIFTKNDKNGDKCASGGQESGLKLIFERGVAILVRPWRFPGQPKKFVFFSIKVGTINSGTSLDSREQFKKTGKLELYYYNCTFPDCQIVDSGKTFFSLRRNENGFKTSSGEGGCRMAPATIAAGAVSERREFTGQLAGVSTALAIYSTVTG